MPFVTEEIWSHLPLDESSLLMGESYPEVDQSLVNKAAEGDLGKMMNAVVEVRRWRDQVAASPAAIIPAALSASGYERTAEQLARMARLEWVDGAIEGGEKHSPNGSRNTIARVPVLGGTIEIFATDAVDLEAGERRNQQRRAKLEAEIEKCTRKLDNESYVAKAPPQIVEAERQKLTRLREELDALG
jgi:valyl-tRNA synthetase